MKMTPELKAFRHYRKNIDHYLEKMKQWWGDEEKYEEMNREIAFKFNADMKSLSPSK